MIEPTVNVNDVYQMGNDYAPKVEDLYQLTDAEGNSTYRDGIYTQLNPNLSAKGGTVAKSYAINGQTYEGDYWKNTDGFNKRTVMTNPFADIETSAYSTGDVISDVETIYLADAEPTTAQVPATAQDPAKA